MTEQQQAAPPEAAKDDEQKPQDGADVKTFTPEYVEKLRQEAAKYRVQAKDNAEKAQQFDALQEQQKTEQQRLEERAAAAEKTAQDSATEASRLRVALDKGLTPSQAKRLVGTTEEELAADADELLADLGKGKPRGDVGQGTRGTQPASAGPEQDFADFMKGQMGR